MKPTAAGYIYSGWIRHRRFTPMRHEFRMPVAMLCIDIDQWSQLFKGVPFWSSSRFSAGWLRQEDYLNTIPGSTLRERVNHAVQQATGRVVNGKIYLLSHPRYMGFGMNPISCFYCYGADGTTPEYLVAEVTNTPWRERIAYVIPCSNTTKQHARFRKQMHVSPFNPMEMDYLMHFNFPDAKHYVHLENRDAQDVVVTDATLMLEQHAMTREALVRLLWHFPLMTLQVAVGIYWQALKLWLKGARFYHHRSSSHTVSSSLNPKGVHP